MILKTPKTVPDRLEIAPPAIGKGGNWWAYDDKTGKFTDTGVKAKGDTGAPGRDGKDGHTLYVTAKLTGSYRNYKTTGIKLSVSVYYDGAEINIASTTAQFRLRGGLDIYKEWTAWGAYEPWMDKNNRNGTSLENEVKVTYKGLTAIAYARLEHVIDGKDGTSQYTKTVVDTRGLDENKYFLVTFPLSQAAKTGLWINKVLDGKTASWQKHSAGSTLTLHWEERGTGWGAVHNDRKIITYFESFSSVIQAGSLGQASYTSTGVIYVRGGATYRFTTSNLDGTPGPVPSLQKNDYVFVFNGKELARLPATKDSVERIVTDKEKADQKANELRTALDNANTLIEGLSTIRDEIRNGTVEPRKFKDIQYLLDALQKDGSFKTGILLSSVIALSGKDGAITSYLSGARGDGIAMLRAGVENFGGAGGKPETAQTTVWSDGSVDIGDMHFVNEKDPKADHIDFTDKAENHTYLQIGGAPKTEKEILKEGTVTKEVKVPDIGGKESGKHLVDYFKSQESNRGVKYIATLNAQATSMAQLIHTDPDGTAHYERYPASVSVHLLLEVYDGDSTTVKYSTTSETLTASVASKDFAIRSREPAFPKDMRAEEYVNKPVTVTVPASRIALYDFVRLSLVVTSTSNGDGAHAYGGVTDILNYLPYSNRKSLVSIMRDKVAFFFSRQKYLLFNYLSDYLVKIVGNVLVQGTIKADYVDMPGTQICGAIFDKNGTEVKAFGKAKNKSGSSYAHAYYDYSAKEYTVYHSIGHTKYIPMVTVTDTKSARQLCVSDISSYSFKVIAYFSDYTQGQVGFSYIAFKAD